MLKLSLVLACLFIFAVANVTDAAEKAAKAKGPLDFTMKDIDGKEVNLAEAYGKNTVLLVNVASRCGYTKQYEGLQALYAKYKDKGLIIVGVPANNFGSQEPGTDEQIKEFCSSKYSVTFPMLSKVSVKGEDICPLYKHLTSKETNPKFAGDVKWNFEKFLVVKGEVVGRYPSKVTPEDLDKEFAKSLK